MAVGTQGKTVNCGFMLLVQKRTTDWRPYASSCLYIPFLGNWLLRGPWWRKVSSRKRTGRRIITWRYLAFLLPSRTIPDRFLCSCTDLYVLNLWTRECCVAVSLPRLGLPFCNKVARVYLFNMFLLVLPIMKYFTVFYFRDTFLRMFHEIHS